MPAPPNRELLGTRPDHQRHARHGSAAPLWDSTQLAFLAFLHQVLLRPARIGTLVGLGGMITVVVVRGDEWWIVLGVVLFQATAAAFTAMWVDFEPAATRRAAQADWPARYVPQQRRPGAEQ